MAALIILVLTLIVSVIGLSSPAFLARCVLIPFRVSHGSGYAGLITSGFVHADMAHMLFNLITYFSFAFRLESAMGSMMFAVLYFSAMLVGGLGTVYKHRDNPQYASLGASGAVLGVLFASLVYFPRQSISFLLLPIPIPAPLFAVGYLAYSWYSSRTPRGNVNHDAHIFGALTGLLFVLVTDPTAFAAAVRAWT
jgi:membrane associated rhomboid family serine protease